MNSKAKWIGHLAVFSAYLIFGFNIIVCKDLTASPIVSPMGIVLLRSLGAGALFWILSCFTKKEHVPLRDLGAIFLAALFGYFLTQYTFLEAIRLISPMETALMTSLSPVYTMLIAAVALHEPITGKKIAGVIVSLAGIVYLILTGMSGAAPGSSGSVNLFGILLMVGNAVSFSIYLGVFRPVISRYSVVTFMKWIFLFSALMTAPLGLKDIFTAQYDSVGTIWYAELAYLIIMATFVAYFLIPMGQKIIRPTLVSMYSYVQPIVAIAISIAIGMDTLSIAKVVATAMVFSGVYIVSRSRSGQHHPRRATYPSRTDASTR